MVSRACLEKLSADGALNPSGGGRSRAALSLKSKSPSDRRTAGRGYAKVGVHRLVCRSPIYWRAHVEIENGSVEDQIDQAPGPGTSSEIEICNQFDVNLLVGSEKHAAADVLEQKRRAVGHRVGPRSQDTSYQIDVARFE